MAAQQDLLSPSDRAALADGFRPLEAVNPGLPDRLVPYVTEGDDDSALSALAKTPNVAELLGIDLSYAGLPPPSRQTPLPAWDALLQRHARPAPPLARLPHQLTSFPEAGPTGNPEARSIPGTVALPFVMFPSPGLNQ